MNEKWLDLSIQKIAYAMYVPQNTGKKVHENRSHHALVLNASSTIIDYIFADGNTLHTRGGNLFYLPNGASYRVNSTAFGGCYVINFDADIADNPFSISFRSNDLILHNFKAACDAWKSGNECASLLSMRAIYDAIYQTHKESKKQYISGKQLKLIAPAIEEINRSFTENETSISKLAQLCGISEVYFRRLFLSETGLSPKEYIIRKRIECAKTLLSTGDFSVSEVARLSGYAEPCHFSREFSLRVGVSPSQYCSK